jgi:hypothetical protein
MKLLNMQSSPLFPTLLLTSPSQAHIRIFLSIVFSNALNLRSTFSVRDQVSHPYTTRGKIIFMYTYRVVKHFLYQ